MKEQIDPQAFLPLTPAMFHVLVSLADHDKHGWAILKEVAERSGGKVQLSPGTLYGLVKRLLEQGLIAESKERPPRYWDDQRRRYYRLTDLGRLVAEAEVERMQAAIREALAKDLRPQAQEGTA